LNSGGGEGGDPEVEGGRKDCWQATVRYGPNVSVVLPWAVVVVVVVVVVFVERRGRVGAAVERVRMGMRRMVMAWVMVGMCMVGFFLQRGLLYPEW